LSMNFLYVCSCTWQTSSSFGSRTKPSIYSINSIATCHTHPFKRLPITASLGSDCCTIRFCGEISCEEVIALLLKFIRTIIICCRSWISLDFPIEGSISNQSLNVIYYLFSSLEILITIDIYEVWISTGFTFCSYWWYSSCASLFCNWLSSLRYCLLISKFLVIFTILWEKVINISLCLRSARLILACYSFDAIIMKIGLLFW
jgi:hypothetical protein